MKKQSYIILLQDLLFDAMYSTENCGRNELEYFRRDFYSESRFDHLILNPQILTIHANGEWTNREKLSIDDVRHDYWDIMLVQPGELECISCGPMLLSHDIIQRKKLWDYSHDHPIKYKQLMYDLCKMMLPAPINFLPL